MTTNEPSEAELKNEEIRAGETRKAREWARGCTPDTYTGPVGSGCPGDDGLDDDDEYGY